LTPSHPTPPSQRALVLEADEHRERARAAEAARPKPAKVKKTTDDVRPPTQEEMLAEAAQTELLNTADLQRILAMEEETKRRAVVVKQPYEGPLVRFRSSKQHGDELLFLRGADPQLGMPHGFAPGLMPGPKAVCAVTGRDARYQDPVTELPYADARALAVIRSAAEGDRLHTLPFFAAAKQSARLLGQFRRQRTGAADAMASAAVAVA
jgi:vacuolar protein sorting-associated protein 72